MDKNTILEGLHPLEIKLLLGLPQEESLTAAVIEEKLGYNTSQANQVLSWLAQKELVREASRRTAVSSAAASTKGERSSRALAMRRSRR